jgi:hypothetical protein
MLVKCLYKSCNNCNQLQFLIIYSASNGNF